MARIRKFAQIAGGLAEPQYGSGQFVLYYDVDSPISSSNSKIVFSLGGGLQVIITGSNLQSGNGLVTRIDLFDANTSTTLTTIDQLGSGLDVDLFTTDDPNRAAAIFGNPNSYIGINDKDTIRGSGSPDTITGLGGDDDLAGALSNDVVDGGDGIDRVAGNAGADTVTGGDGDDRIWGDFDFFNNDPAYYGVSGADRMDGGTGNDQLFGGEKGDSLNGGDGDDSLNPFWRYEAGDVLDGGAGSDVATIRMRTFSDFGYDDPTARSFDFSSSHTAAGALTGGIRLRNIERVNFLGGSGADTVVGTIGNDTLEGGKGTDILRGGAGDDFLHALENFGPPTTGQTDADELNGGIGNDTAVIFYRDQADGKQLNFATLGPSSNLTLADGKKLISIENLRIFCGMGDDTVTGGAGNDTLNGHLGEDILRGGAGDDELAYDSRNSQLNPEPAAVTERVDGGAGIDKLRLSLMYTDAQASYDFRNLSSATPQTFSPSANLKVQVSNIEQVAADASSRGPTAITLIGMNQTGALSQLGDELIASTGDCKLMGLAGNDTLTARLGNDTLDGGAGADGMFGGTGDDLFMVDNVLDRASDSTFAFEDGGFDTVKSTVTYTLLPGLEQLNLLGSNQLDGSGNDTANIIIGNQNKNVLSGLAGDDVLNGGFGNDVFFGGLGHDIADYSAAASVVSLAVTAAQATGALGSDRLANVEGLIGSSGNDRFTGSTAANSLEGRSGNDRLLGGDGNDTLKGGLGNDTLDGGTGIDLADFAGATANLTVSLVVTAVQATGMGKDKLSGVENLSGSTRNDHFTGSNSANALTGLAGNDWLEALGANDKLEGGDGNDTLLGGAGDDTLNGGEGADRVEGGFGKDVLFGGTPDSIEPGSTFVYRVVADSRPGALADQIVDFFSNGGSVRNDKIDLSKIDANSTLAGNQTFKEVGTLSGVAGEVQFISEGVIGNGHSEIKAEVDGKAGIDFQIFIIDPQNLSGNVIL